MNCPLCLAPKPLPIDVETSRNFYVCNSCNLVFTNTISNKESKNKSSNAMGLSKKGKSIFSSSVDEIASQITPEMIGLDYNLNVYPQISNLLIKRGFNCHSLDSSVQESSLSGGYDYIILGEAFGKFHIAAKEIKKLKGLLKPGGKLFIVNKRWKDEPDVRKRITANSFNSLSLYHNNSISFITKRYGFELERFKEDFLAVLKNK